MGARKAVECASPLQQPLTAVTCGCFPGVRRRSSGRCGSRGGPLYFAAFIQSVQANPSLRSCPFVVITPSAKKRPLCVCCCKTPIFLLSEKIEARLIVQHKPTHSRKKVLLRLSQDHKKVAHRNALHNTTLLYYGPDPTF